ncbi:hypothetical protein [Nocardioides sp.]|uniref:hypothetical protein n=1 Tax=Nocardioides sp. TaxID=35761 RepID=UPI0039E71D8E
MGMGTYTLDGVPLDDPAGRWMLSDSTLLGPLPAPSLSAVKIPGIHGTVPTPPTTRDAGSHTVGLIVTDNNEAGAATGDHQQMRKNLSALYALATPVGRLPVLRYIPHLAVTPRDARVRLLAAIEPEMADPYTARITLPFDLPEVFWRESVEHTFASEAVAAWEASPDELNGSTGTIADPVFLCTGPMTSCVITDFATGKVLTWNGNVAAGQRLRLEPASMKAYRTVGEQWTGGTDVSGGLSTGPGGFDLNPNAAGEIGWTLARTGAGVTQARVRRAFL